MSERASAGAQTLRCGSACAEPIGSWIKALPCATAGSAEARAQQWCALCLFTHASSAHICSALRAFVRGWPQAQLACGRKSPGRFELVCRIVGASDKTVRHAATGECLDVDRSVGPIVQTWSCNGGSNQQFTMSGGHLTAGSGQCIAARQGKPSRAGEQLQLWAKPLAGGDVAALVINAYNNQSFAATIDLHGHLGFAVGATVHVRNIWARSDEGRAMGSFVTDEVGAHDSRMFRFSPVRELADSD